MATGRKQMKKKHTEEKKDKVFDFIEDEKKELSGSEDEVRGKITFKM